MAGVSVTSVNLDQNTKTAELWVQAIAGGDPVKLAVGQPGDSGPQFAPEGRRILFLSSREGGQQIWLAEFDPATGATSNAKKLTAISTEADNATLVSRRRVNCLYFHGLSRLRGDHSFGLCAGDKCNADRDAAQAASKVKAQIFTHLLYRHWNHYTGDKRSHLFLVSVATGAMRDLTPNDPHDVPPFSLEGWRRIRHCARLERAGLYGESRSSTGHLAPARRFITLDLTNPAAKPAKVSTSAGGNFNPAYSPDGKYLAWRSQARAGYESDKFRLFVYDRKARVVEDLLSSAIAFSPTPKPARFDLWVDEFQWDKDSKLIYFTSGDTGQSLIYSISIGQKQLDRYGKMHGEWSGVQGIWLNGRYRLLGTLMRAEMPSEVVLATHWRLTILLGQWSLLWIARLLPRKLRNNNMSQLKSPTSTTHSSRNSIFPRMESFWFTAKDGAKLEGFLIRPPGFDSSKKYPVKFLIHGGPQGAWGDPGPIAGTPNFLPPMATSSS